MLWRRSVGWLAVLALAPVGACRSKAKPESEGAVLVRGTVSLHDQLSALAPPSSGRLEVRLVDLDGRTLARLTYPAVVLPVGYAFSSRPGGLSAESARVLAQSGFFVSASYTLNRRPGTAPIAFSGERWGRVGKPYPMRLGDPADIALSSLISSTAAPALARGSSVTASVGRFVAEVASTNSVARDPTNPVLAHGIISIDSRMRAQHGGFLHLRLFSMDYMRPFTFLRFENVQFPLRYTIRAKDRFYPGSLEIASAHKFYADATYNPPGLTADFGVFAWEPPAIMGEAWGEGGITHSLRMGERADIVLNGYWTAETLQGQLRRRDEARVEGWVFVKESLRSKIRPRNRLVVGILKEKKSIDEQTVFLAAKLYENFNPQLPIAYHMFDEDFLQKPIDPKWRGSFLARVESLDAEGKVVSRFLGGRAREDSGITVFVRTLRIAIVKEQGTWDPFANQPELERLEPSEVTHD